MKAARTVINRRVGVKRSSLHVYYCPICGQHHITKQPRSNTLKKSKRYPSRVSELDDTDLYD